MDENETLQAISKKIANAKRLFVLTGAGLGVASGLPTFRGPGGVWNGKRPEDMSSTTGFKRDPIGVWDWYNMRIARYKEAIPNAGHHAITALQVMIPNLTIVTQNVDGLQARSGAKNIIELHGSIFDLKCTGVRHKYEGVIRTLDGPFEGNPNSDQPYKHDGCGGTFRPGVVFFGENLPYKALADAQHESFHADTIVVIGTSAQVEPAASLARIHDSNIVLIEINPEPVLSHRTDLVLAQSAEIVLPKIVDMVKSYLA
jgi:NAD-dependent deacetylase